MLSIRIPEMPWIVSDDSTKLKISRNGSGNYLADINLHLLRPEMAMKTGENLQVFVREVFLTFILLIQMLTFPAFPFFNPGNYLLLVFPE